MTELVDLRAILRSELERIGINAFVFEAVYGAHPDDAETVSLNEVTETDVFVLVIGDSYGEITEREYHHARSLDKPCFVYERLGAQRTDQRLIDFIAKISGPRGVPLRKQFLNAKDLSEYVAADVQSWLVREYRKLSARKLSGTESTRRAAQLEDNIRRLAASSNHPLASGNTADLLASQLRQWFEALEYPNEVEPYVAADYIDLSVRVPVRRRQFQQTLVRCKDGEIRAPDVTAAMNILDERSLDEIWLVSQRRISPAARQAAEANGHVVLYTFDELIEEDVNFDRYFDWVDEEVRKSNIQKQYEPLAVITNELNTSGKIEAQSHYDDVAAYVDQWLADNDGEHLSLLGEFGTGKSWFALKYSADLIDTYRKARSSGLARPRVPLVIRLRDYARGFKDVGSLLTEFVFREHQINIRSFAILETLNRMGRLLFIFDGFDEMAARVDRQKMVDNFWSLAAVLGPGSKAILTCRTEYFRFAQEAQNVFAGQMRGSPGRDLTDPTRFQIATLQMFDDTRLRSVLSRRSDPTLVESVLANPRLADLAKRPVMIDLLIEAMPNLSSAKADLAQVYFQAVKMKMQRDIRLGRTFTSMADKTYFLCEVSWAMLSSRKLKFHFRDIPDHIRTYFGVPEGSIEEDHWRHDLLAQTMLVRNEDGYYRPAHMSLVEFFCAYKLAAMLGALKPEFAELVNDDKSPATGQPPKSVSWNEFFCSSISAAHKPSRIREFCLDTSEELSKSWSAIVPDNAMSEFIFDLSGRERLVNAVRQLNTHDSVNMVVVSKVLEILAFSQDLRNVDFTKLQASGCKLHDCDLSQAILVDSTWQDAVFERVNLSGARLSGAVFRKPRFLNVTLDNADLTNTRFEGDVQITAEVVEARWHKLGGQDLLSVKLYDGRTIQATLTRDQIVEICASSEHDLGMHASQGNPATLNAQGAGWKRGEHWYRNSFDNGVLAHFDFGNAGPGGDVETLHVTFERDGRTIFDSRFYDATDLNGSHADRVICASRNGEMVCVLEGDWKQNESATLIICGLPGTDEVHDQDKPKAPGGLVVQKRRLNDFRGGEVYQGPNTVDCRGAAFNWDNSLLAIREQPNQIGFWRVDDGTCLGHIRFEPSLRETILDGATGLPTSLIRANSDGRLGWETLDPSV